MQITSSAFEDGGKIPVDYSADGDGSLPPLQIDDLPVGSVTLAIVCHDPDIPKERRPNGFDHWVVWNLPLDTTSIADEEDHEGVVGLNTFDDVGWVPCTPPPGEGPHRYIFTVYALDTKLELPLESTRADLEEAMEDHIIEDAQLIGTYER